MRFRRTLRLATVLALGLATSPSLSCSIGYRFIIVNASQDAVQVAYSLRPEWAHFEGQVLRYDVEPLFELAISELGTRKAQWRPVAPDRVSVDLDKGTVTVSLAGATALQVAQISNYSGNDRECDRFPIESLTLTGTRGDVRLSGEQVRHHFVPTDDSYYRLVYG